MEKFKLLALFLTLGATGWAQDDPAPAEAAPRKARIVEFRIGSLGNEEPPAPMPLGPKMYNFRGRLELIRQMASDPDVDALALDLDGVLDHARTLDLLRELRGFKDRGKKIVCYSEMLDRGSLVYASLADHLVVPPSALVTLEGISAEVLYMKDLLEKVHVEMEVLHVGDFKTAYEDFGRSHMSPEQRQSITDLMQEFFQQCVRTIARNRDISEEAVTAGFEEVFVTPQRAVELGLIDAVGYQDEFDAQVKQLLGREVERVKNYGDTSKEDLEKLLSNPLAFFAALPRLLEPPEPKLPDGPRIAVVYASGPIQSGKSVQGFGGDITMGSETIVEALEKTLEDDDIKAVVLRVNSPGGSALASDMIWRAVQRVREKKPVVASMGSVAASGGYWISMGCDRIVAQPSTITGSIGVVSMLPDVSRTLKDIGINVEVVGVGPHTEELSILRDGPTPFLKQKLTQMMEQVYEDFIRKVSEGRHMDPLKVREHAEGRVWTGRQAHEIGLVDGLGGLRESIVLACYLAGGLKPETTPVAEYPRAPSFFDQIEEMMEGMVSIEGQLLSGLERAHLDELAALVRVARDGRSPLHPERVQALLPFCLRVR